MAARDCGLKKLIIGAEFRLISGLKLVVLVQNSAGYAELCQLITRGRRAADKGSYRLDADDFAGGLPGCLVLWIPDRQLTLAAADAWILETFRQRLWVAVELLADGLQRQRIERLRVLGDTLGVPLVACGDVHMHCRERRAVQDTVTAIREGVTLDRAGFALYPNGERYLRPLEVLSAVYPPDLLSASQQIAAQTAFSLDELRYEYPDELIPEGQTPASYLRQLTESGMRRR